MRSTEPVAGHESARQLFGTLAVEVVLLIALVALLASGARFLGMMEARAGRADNVDGVVDGLNGMFLLSREYSRSGQLGWPHGVQEEDRDRVWTWSPPAQAPQSEAPDGDFIEIQGELVEAEVAVVRVHRTR